MKIHEYQAKKLFQKFGIETTRGITVKRHFRAAEIAERIGGDAFVIKAQVHCGGRGKAGGVKFARTPKEVEAAVKEIIGMKLVTKQTGEEGKIVNKVLIERASKIEKEFYLSIAVDNENAGLVLIASGEGGTEIEETAQKNPEKIIKVSAPLDGFKSYHLLYVAKMIGLPKSLYSDFYKMVNGMHKLFVELDCSLVEINPLIINGNGQLVALDAKINFDDNAMFRHPDVQKLRDKLEENEKEVEASKYDLSYVQLDGNIGCMVNGAGLAMATMDIVQAFGGMPANFLDVGGSATAEKVAAAFRILLSDKNIKAIFVNIFGGIMKCDVLADGIVKAAKATKLKVPLIVRMDGTNVELGKQILFESGLKIETADSMAEGARLSVLCAQQNTEA